MTGHERIAASNIKACFNYEIGAIYNSWLDGYFEDIPTLEEAKDMIYTLSMHDRYGSGYSVVDGAPKEMRFAGKEFCKRYIDKLFANDSDVAEIPWKE